MHSTRARSCTSSRAILFDHAGQAVAVAQQEFRQIFPQPGWVEHDAHEIWATQFGRGPRCCKSAASQGRLTRYKKSTRSASPTSARPPCCGTASHRPSPSTTPSSGRTAAPRPSATSCVRGQDKPIQKKTGLVLDAYFSGHQGAVDCWTTCPAPAPAPSAGELAFGTIDSWLLWNLTGGKVHATDASNASRTMLYNIHTLQWDDELLALFGVPRSDAAARCRPAVYGHRPQVLGAAASPSPASPATSRPPSSARPALKPGMAKNTYGTGCFMLMNTGTKPRAQPQPSAHHRGWRGIGGVAPNTPGRWRVHRRRGHPVAARRPGIIKSAPEVEALAARCPTPGRVSGARLCRPRVRRTGMAMPAARCWA
jgi:glycerol kinase